MLWQNKGIIKEQREGARGDGHGWEQPGALGCHCLTSSFAHWEQQSLPADREVTGLGPLEVTLFLRYWGSDNPQWQQRTVFC